MAGDKARATTLGLCVPYHSPMDMLPMLSSIAVKTHSLCMRSNTAQCSKQKWEHVEVPLRMTSSTKRSWIYNPPMYTYTLEMH